MSTETTTSEATVITIETLTELFKKIVTGEKDAAKADARFLVYGLDLRAEKDKRENWTEADAYLALKQTYVAATRGYTVKLEKTGPAKNAPIKVTLGEDATTENEDGTKTVNYTVADVETELKRLATDFAKVMKIAFPESDGRKLQDYGFTYNGPIKDYRKRLGVNDMLKLSRGEKLPLSKHKNREFPLPPEIVFDDEKAAREAKEKEDAESARLQALAADAKAADAAAAAAGGKPAGETPAGESQQQTPAGESKPHETTPEELAKQKREAAGDGPMSPTDALSVAIAVGKSRGISYEIAAAILRESYGIKTA